MGIIIYTIFTLIPHEEILVAEGTYEVVRVKEFDPGGSISVLFSRIAKQTEEELKN